MTWNASKQKGAAVIVMTAVLGSVAFLVMYFAPRQHPLLQEAHRCLESHDFRQAGVHLGNYLREHPRDVSVRMLAAQTARRGDDFAEALGHLRVCDREQGPSAFGLLEFKLIGLQQGDLSDAEAWLDRCGSNSDDPQHSLVLEALIVGSLKTVFEQMQREMQSQGREALVDTDILRRALDLWDNEPRPRADQVQGLVWRGMLNSLERDYPQAQASLRQALRLDPQHAQARLYLAELLALEKPDEAAAHFQVLFEADPRNRRVRLRLAASQRTLGHLKEAAQMLDEMLVADPDDAEAMLERGKIALDDERLDEAERWLRQAHHQAPQLPEAALVLARCLQQAGKEVEARAVRDRAQRIEEERRRRQHESRQKAKSG